MKDSVDAWLDSILEKEMKTIDKIMVDMTKNIQKDLYNQTILLLDTYYAGYTRPPRQYVRIDERKSEKPRGKNGKFIPKKGKAGRDSALGKSLKKAIQNGEDTICFAVNYQNGYSAGVKFRDEDFETSIDINHPNAGIEEFDIVKNFLFSSMNGVGNHEKMQRSPSAAAELSRYINNYDNKIDQFYRSACAQYR